METLAIIFLIIVVVLFILTQIKSYCDEQRSKEDKIYRNEANKRRNIL